MAGFVQEYSALRWLAVAAFTLAAMIVLRRLAAAHPYAVAARGPASMPDAEPPRHAGPRRISSREHEAGSPGWAGPPDIARAAGLEAPRAGVRAIDPESDAAHLLMCLVMLAMLVFPASADPRALHGILTAMTLVYALLLAGRILQWRQARPARPADSVMAFAYHVVAAAAMLYAMSGHTVSGHTAPEPAPMLALAALFLADALATAVPSSRSALRHIFPHPIGSAGPVAVLPHVVMDLGTAYMLIAAAIG